MAPLRVLNATRLFIAVAALTTVGPGILRADGIEGSILIKRKLTKRRVTPSASTYERGMTVELSAPQTVDFLAFERARTVIYLEGHFAFRPVTLELEQKNRQFVTDTMVVPVGSTVSFPNRDPIFHNVFSLSKVKSFDLGNYPQDHTRTVTFPKPGIVFVNCHLHPNMAAAIVVSPNGWATKADSAGHFVLPDVPPGTYTIVAWHRAAGFFQQVVKVPANRAAAVEFTIPLDGPDDAKVLAQN